jgi:hypothetical protein
MMEGPFSLFSAIPRFKGQKAELLPVTTGVAEAASLPANFLFIVSWFALFLAKTRISEELAAPRAKETIT